jgi:hypothetical protein
VVSNCGVILAFYTFAEHGLKNSVGFFQIQAAIETAGKKSNLQADEDRPNYMVNLEGAATYPLLDRSYVGITTGEIGHSYQPSDPHLPDCSTLAAALRFVTWLIDDSPGAPAPHIFTANYFVLQTPARVWNSKLLSRIGQMRCGDRRQAVQSYLDTLTYHAAMVTKMSEPLTWGLVFGGIVVSAVVLYVAGRRAFILMNRLRKEKMEMYTIAKKNIRITPTLISPVDRYKGVVASRKVLDRYIPTASLQCLSTGTWGEHEVFLRPCSLVLHKLKHAAKMRVLQLVEITRSHKNVVAFYGLTELPNGRCLVCNFCKKRRVFLGASPVPNVAFHRSLW